jgi:glycosyltransferase involved in cell wall biosynthesis
LVNAAIISQKEKIDIIHAHWLIPSGLTAWVCRKVFQKPFIVTVHGSDVFPFRKSVLRHLLKTVLDNCNACTVNSSATASAISEITKIKRNLVIIPMGVGLNVFHPARRVEDTSLKSEAHEPTILTAGRLIEWKGINYLVEAMPFVLKQFPQAKLVICGDGPERKTLEKLVCRLNMTERVAFEGSIPNNELPSRYWNASVFVLPSVLVDGTGETEALGVVLLEAMACGTPVIASSIGGITDIITDGWNGLLAEQKKPLDIADKITKLLSDERTRQRLSENGLQRIKERFSWEVVVDRFVETYEQLR